MKPVDFDDVREIGLALPGVEESTAYGSPALKLRGKLLACIPVNPSAEPGSLAVRVNLDDRAALLAESSDVYYVTSHYESHPIVLVRLAKVRREMLRDLLLMAHRFVTSKKASPRKRR